MPRPASAAASAARRRGGLFGRPSSPGDARPAGGRRQQRRRPRRSRRCSASSSSAAAIISSVMTWIGCVSSNTVAGATGGASSAEPAVSAAARDAVVATMTSAPAARRCGRRDRPGRAASGATASGHDSAGRLDGGGVGIGGGRAPDRRLPAPALGLAQRRHLGGELGRRLAPRCARPGSDESPVSEPAVPAPRDATVPSRANRPASSCRSASARASSAFEALDLGSFSLRACQKASLSACVSRAGGSRRAPAGCSS